MTSSSNGIWLRRETSPTEERTVLVPADAAALIAEGVRVTVEEADNRVFPIEEYAAAGATIVQGDTWDTAPAGEVILGLKEPSGHVHDLTHRHIFFGHAYKGQDGGPALLRRFVEGGGELYDLEYLTHEDGRRVVAFGFWAGYVGAALAALHHRGQLHALESMTRAELDAQLRTAKDDAKALVIGALGRSGRGAVEALEVAGIPTTRWDIEETRNLDQNAVLAHDILVNTVFADAPGTPFLTAADLPRTDRVLATVSDVTCDVTSTANRLPVNDAVTDWANPSRRLHADPVLDVIAVDNLPSLLPRESSTDFSAGLLPHLRTWSANGPVWTRALEHFDRAKSLL